MTTHSMNPPAHEPIDRLGEVERIVVAGAFDGFTVRVVNHEGWLERFPSGFAPLPRTMDGEYFDICPTRIVAISGDLSDDEFLRFCMAISVWQNQSMLNFVLKYSAESIVDTFADDFPEHAAILMLVADDHGQSLIDFLGARQMQRGTLGP